MKLDHIVLLVSDLDASLPYYDKLLGLLGFTKSREHVWGNEDGVYFDFKQASEVGEGYRRYGVGLNHHGFTAETRQQVDEIAEAMRTAGFEVPETQLLGSLYALFMKDRDGMRFEITYYG